MKKVLFVLLLFLLNADHADAREVVVNLPVINDEGLDTAPYPGLWSDVHDTLYGRYDNSREDALDIYTGAWHSDTGYIAMYRSFISFDTRSIPLKAEILSAKVVLTPKWIADSVSDDYSYINVYPSFQSSSTKVSLTDISLCGDAFTNPTAFTNSKAVGDLIVDSQFGFDLNLEGIDWINKGGWTPFCLREGHDSANQEIVNNSRTWISSGIIVYSNENSIVEFRPYLQVRYELVDELSDHLLYTQVISPHPSLEETASWASSSYAGGGTYLCGSTIAACGCVITSLVMAGRNAGVGTDVLGQDVNPGNMNDYLQAVNGYTNDGAIKWLAGSAYLGELTSDGRIASRFAAAPKRPGDLTTTAFIDASLAAGDNAVLAYKHGHFVWLPEKTADSYVVRDPWWYDTLTADDADPAGEKYIKDYNNVFTDARVIKISDELVEFSGTDIELHLQGTAELLFQKATGEQVGYVDGSVLINLENASYGNTEVIGLNGVPADANAGKHLLVYEAGEEFTIDVVGTDEGEFDLEFFTINEFGETTTFTFNGLTFPGVVTTFTFNLVTGEVTEQPVSYEDFQLIVGTLLGDATTQQQKFFAKRAQRIMDGLLEKTVSQTLQEIEVFAKLLKAKKVESPRFTSVLDKLRVQVQN